MENKSKETVTEQQKKPSPVYDQILQVLYAPRKAFKEIAQEPKYLGPILILILFVAANTAYGYTIISKSYIEQTLPKVDASTGQFDAWTENATLWNSAPGVNITPNFNDFVNSSYDGNRSISFSAVNSSQIFMQLMNVGPVNCSGPDGYKNVSLRIEMVDPLTAPSNASIYLFSGSNSNYLYYNLTDTLSDMSASVWNNLTIPLATESWVNNGADWSNITGLKLEVGWHQNFTTITMLVDGLFFRGLFQTPMDAAGASYLFSYSLSSVLQFAIEWIFVSGIIFMAARGLGAKTVWKPILILVGFALIVLVVQTLINIIAISTLPNLYYSFEFLGGTTTEVSAATNRLYDQTALVSAISGYVRIATLAWLVALCAVASRLRTELPWIKSALISIVAVVVTTIVMFLFT